MGLPIAIFLTLGGAGLLAWIVYSVRAMHTEVHSTRKLVETLAAAFGGGHAAAAVTEGTLGAMVRLQVDGDDGQRPRHTRPDEARVAGLSLDEQIDARHDALCAGPLAVGAVRLLPGAGADLHVAGDAEELDGELLRVEVIGQVGGDVWIDLPAEPIAGGRRLPLPSSRVIVR